MCRLAVFFDCETRNAFQRFIDQSFLKKNTPDQDFDFDSDINQDGCGWVFIFRHDLIVEKYMHATLPMYEGPFSIAVGHLRHKGSECTGDVSLNNIHPFVYEHHIFCHNGFIRDFEKNQRFFSDLFFPPLGNTDSEYILSHLIRIFQNKEGDMIETILYFFRRCEEFNIPILANFVWLYKDQLLVTRYSNLFEDSCCSLYVQENMISSEPVLPTFVAFPKQHLMYFVKKKDKWTCSRIQNT